MKPLNPQVLIVGAGPYGLSLAYELHCRGTRVAFAGRPFSTWLDHTMTGADLRSDVNASEIYAADRAFDLRRFLRMRYGSEQGRSLARRRIPVPVFREYARWVADRFPLAPIGPHVASLERSPSGGFDAHLDDGTAIHADEVVVASGIGAHRYLPDALAALPEDRVVHSWDIQRVEDQRDLRLLVVGGGQSAAEAVALLAPHNTVSWVHRSPLVFYSEPLNLPKTMYRLALKASTWFWRIPGPLRRVLDAQFVASTITPDMQRRIVRDDIPRARADVADLGLRAEADHIRSDALDREFDFVIACTGYRYDVGALPYLDDALTHAIDTLPSGAPRLDRHFSTSVPGLHVIGGLAEPTHGPGQRFMFGCRHSTVSVSEALGAK